MQQVTRYEEELHTHSVWFFVIARLWSGYNKKPLK